jgi:hypothetical protein
MMDSKPLSIGASMRERAEHKRRRKRYPTMGFVEWMYHYNITTGTWGSAGNRARREDFSRLVIDAIQSAVRAGRLTVVTGPHDLYSCLNKHFSYAYWLDFTPHVERIWAKYESLCMKVRP